MYDLPKLFRYGVQILTAFALLSLSNSWLSWIEGSTWIIPIVFPLLCFGITAIINFVNFMDGLDGLVAGCMAVAIWAGTIHLSSPLSTVPLLGALLGFLFWNWSPAKVFMGDVGSTFLGAVFACLIFQLPSWQEALGLMLVATPLLGDACFCVLRRQLAGQSVFKAHRLHLFQRLHQSGWQHAQVSSLYIFATLVLALANMFGGLSWVLGMALGELLTGLWLDQRVAIPFMGYSNDQ